MKKWFSRITTGKRTLVAVATSIILLIPYLASFKNQTAKGPLIDQMFNFNAYDVQRLLGSYGAGGRVEYMRAEIFDFVYILILAATISLIVLYAFNKRGWAGTLAALPLLAGSLNATKAILLVIIIHFYPHEPVNLVMFTNIINTTKTLAMIVMIILLIVALGVIFSKNIIKGSR